MSTGRWMGRPRNRNGLWRQWICFREQYIQITRLHFKSAAMRFIRLSKRKQVPDKTFKAVPLHSQPFFHASR